MASLRGLIRKALRNDPLTEAMIKAEKDVPGSVGSAMTALTAENVSSNPFGTEQSRWDIFGGGEKLSRDPEARAVGRTIGSIFAGWYGAGALGAGAGGSATAASAAGQTAIDLQGREIAKEQAEAEAARQRELIAAMREEKPEAEAVPIADEEAMRRRRRRSLASVMQRRGRQSTILTGGGQGALGA